MADKDQLEMLKKGVTNWNKWRFENNDIEIDLHGANLTHEDLGEVNLNQAYLVGANLSGANLMRAKLLAAELSSSNLREANLREAELTDTFLIDADLNGADLTDALVICSSFKLASLQNAILINADLTESSFVGANLCNADISGAKIDNINMSKWIIKGIKCNHVFIDNKRVDFVEGEFEKRFTQIEKIIDVVINVPMSDLTYYTGRIIEAAINKKHGDGSVVLKGQTALSDNSTKCEFISFQGREKLDSISSIVAVIKDQVNYIFEEHKAKQEDKDFLKIPEKIDLKIIPLEIDSNAFKNVLAERFAKMSPLLQKVVIAIQSAIN